MSNKQQTADRPKELDLSEIETFLTTGDRAALQPRQRAALRKSAVDAIVSGSPINTNSLESGDRPQFIRLVRTESYRYRNRGLFFNPNKTYLH